MRQTQNIVENPAVQEQVIVQEIPQVSIVERIQEQIVSSAPQVVGSFSPLEEFAAPVYNQIHQEQIVTGMTTQHRVGNPAAQEQVTVHGKFLRHTDVCLSVLFLLVFFFSLRDERDCVSACVFDSFFRH